MAPRILFKRTLVSLALSSFSTFAQALQPHAIDKEELLSRYRNKFVRVTEPGISTGFCGLNQGGAPSRLSRKLIMRVNGVGEVQTDNFFGCDVQPVSTGEVLRIFNVGFHSGCLVLLFSNISQHAVTRGLGAFSHQSLELGGTAMWIRAGEDGKDLAQADARASHWFKVFNTAGEAANFGNTAPGVFVSQVKTGMSFAEVEASWEFHRRASIWAKRSCINTKT